MKKNNLNSNSSFSLNTEDAAADNSFANAVNIVVTSEMMSEMQNLRGAIGNMVGAGNPTTEVTANDFSQLDAMTRHQLLQPQYVNSMNMNEASFHATVDIGTTKKCISGCLISMGRWIMCRC